ncbi:MAG: 2Fe-2S iron-sulfur cluster-binding protein [Thioalkalivibrionaceae bacterium]
MSWLAALVIAATAGLTIWITYATLQGLWWSWRNRSRVLRLWVVARRSYATEPGATAPGSSKAADSPGQRWIDLWLVRLSPAPLPSFAAGQYLTVRPPPGTPKRAYSIANGPRWPWAYRLIVQIEPDGRTSPWIDQHARFGRRLQADPPRGSFGWRPEHHAAPLVLVAGGVGITPMLAIVERVAKAGGHGHAVVLIHSVRDPALAVDRDRLSRLASRTPWLTYRLFLTGRASPAAECPIHDAGLWERRRVTVEDLLETDTNGHAHYFFCGSNAFMAALMDGLRARGVEEARLHYEAFSLDVEGGTRIQDCRFGSQVFDFEPEHGTLLSALEAAGCTLEADCRVGDCGVCRVRLATGQVHWLVPEAQSSAASGEVLVCCTRPLGRVTLEPVTDRDAIAHAG